MKTKSNPKGSGRKPVTIDWAMVDDLLQKFCEGTEIAEALGIHPNTLERKGEEAKKWGKGTDYNDFSSYKQQKRSYGQKELRLLQQRTAFGWTDKSGTYHLPSTVMQIWLGKQYLGQSDKSESSVNISQQQPLLEDYDPQNDSVKQNPIPSKED